MDEINITQKSNNGSNNTNIGVLNNGLTVQDACQIAKTLFEENFPRLQEEAMEKVRQRIDDFLEELKSKVESNNIKDFSAFANPDMQYVLNESLVNYARYEQKDKLKFLTELLIKRVNYDKNDYLTIVIDKALSIADQLSLQHLNYLSATFLCKQVSFKNIQTEQQLIEHYTIFANLLDFHDDISISLLNVLGCLELALGSTEDLLAKRYSLNKDNFIANFPKKFLNIHPDYQASHVGVILAIANLENKININFNPTIWVHP